MTFKLLNTGVLKYKSINKFILRKFLSHTAKAKWIKNSQNVHHIKVEEKRSKPVAWTQNVLELSIEIPLLEKLKILLPVIYIFASTYVYLYSTSSESTNSLSNLIG